MNAWRWRGTRVPIHVVIAAVLLSGLALLTLSLAGSAPVGRAAETAPDYAAARLEGGPDLALADLRGDVVVLNGWATWCEPCREEMPFLQQLHDDYAADGLRVVGVSIDRCDADERIREFAADMGVSFTLLHDSKNEFTRTFRASGVPETLLIDRNGSIVRRWQGPLDKDPAQARTLVEGALTGTVTEETTRAAGVTPIGVPVAFLAGLLSFLSPCVLPLIPTYAAVITGLSLTELGSGSPAARARVRRRTLTSGLLFVAGFSLVFIMLGASATLLGGLLHDYRDWLARVGGVVLAVLGLHLLGVLRLPFADRDVRVHLTNRPMGFAGTFLIGIAFGAGWTPCIGPALASILTLAATSASVGQGMGLLAVYSLGLAIPFLFATVALDQFMAGSANVRRWLPRLQRASGVLILVVAALLLTDSMTRLAQFLSFAES